MRMLWLLNPWWEKDEWEREDKQMVELSNLTIKWFPSWINKLSLQPFSLNFVVGPRQVGKTTGIKLFIKDLLERGISPYAILYLNLEFVRDVEELREVLFYYGEIKKENEIPLFLAKI